jgi:hypothetical protein
VRRAGTVRAASRGLLALGLTAVAACGAGGTGASKASKPSAGGKSASVASVRYTAGDAKTPTNPPVTRDIPKLAAEGAGTWKGSWSDTTFGTNGTLTAQLNVDATTKKVSASLEITGAILGKGTVPKITVDADGSKILKDVTVSADDGQGDTVSYQDLPQHTAHVVVKGTAGHPDVATVDLVLVRTEDASNPAPGRIDGTYTVTYTNGTMSKGTVHLTHQ